MIGDLGEACIKVCLHLSFFTRAIISRTTIDYHLPIGVHSGESTTITKGYDYRTTIP